MGKEERRKEKGHPRSEVTPYRKYFTYGQLACTKQTPLK
jgi:hypothetical protein